MNQVKHALFIQGVNAFVSGILSILIPIVLVERKINIQTIGLIFAAYPLIFQLTRISFGIISDFIGKKIFYLSNGIFNILTIVVYYFTSSPLGYAIGKVFEGLTGTSLWSVNRAFFLEQNRSKQKNLIYMRAIDHLLTAIGMFVAGFLLTFLFLVIF